MAGTFLDRGWQSPRWRALDRKRLTRALPADASSAYGIVGYISGEMYAVAGLMVNTTICKVFDGNHCKARFKRDYKS